VSDFQDDRERLLVQVIDSLRQELSTREDTERRQAGALTRVREELADAEDKLEGCARERERSARTIAEWSAIDAQHRRERVRAERDTR